ncbi:MAG: transposase [Nocardioidaceae bacterium]|jgi:transposase|nr:transposase [Nocardioidaceae bacterium]
MTGKAKLRRSGKRSSPTHRHGAAHLVIDTGSPIAVVAREIGGGEAPLGRWVAVERAHDDDPLAALGVGSERSSRRAH